MRRKAGTDSWVREPENNQTPSVYEKERGEERRLIYSGSVNNLSLI